MEPFKNWLNEKAARKIAEAIARGYKHFPEDRFLKNIKRELEPLELKGRMVLMAKRLVETLPADPKKSFPIIRSALKQNEADSVGVAEFLAWPLSHYVAEQGQNHLELSLETLLEITKVFTSEFAIRPFLINHEEKTLKQLIIWTEHENEHVRRLATEGSRPLLPWGMRIPRFVANPKLTLPILEALKNDSAEYVQKSVANHINDHSKNHPDWVAQRLRMWVETGKPSERLLWIVRHGSRTLIKQGHVGALELQGISSKNVKLVSHKIVTPKVKLGGDLQVEVTVKNTGTKPAKALIDHELALAAARSGGKARSKVFKGKSLELAPGQSTTVAMRIPIRPVTVRKYYSGVQHWSVLVNGVKAAAHEFYLQC